MQPEAGKESAGDPETEAERLRVVYHMITLPESEGGAGVTPEVETWSNVEALFPLHDRELNREWIRKWSQKTFLSDEDLNDIRNVYGESVGFYFAFLQDYFAFLIFPAVLGFSCWALLGQYSLVFAVVNSASCMLFVEMWRRKQRDLSVRWQVKGVSVIRTPRRQFKSDKELVDSVTGEKIQIFSPFKRLARQSLQIPLAVLSVVSLGTIIATCFAIEIFISEIYAGPFKSILVFVPTLLLSSLVPTISAFLSTIATRLNDYENHESNAEYADSLIQKLFVINFITSYLPILLTAFVYVPFGSVIVPYLDVLQTFFPQKDQSVKPAKEHNIDRARLRSQVIYFAVTAQIIGQLLEIGMPFVQRKLIRRYKEYSESRSQDKGAKNPNSNAAASRPISHDDPEEAEFLTRVRDEVELESYDVTDDYRELVIQFGNMALFSLVWPLVPLAFLINNWVELRSDFVKICMECRRPTPLRAQGIGPWLDDLSFLAWLGSIVSAALYYIFHADSDGSSYRDIQGWALLLTIIFAEHAYLLCQKIARVVIFFIQTPESRKERADKFSLRKHYFDSILEQHRSSADADVDAGPGAHTPIQTSQPQSQAQVSDPAKEPGIPISRAALEKELRRHSLHSSSPADAFWSHQAGWRETVQVGTGLMESNAIVPRRERETERKNQ